MAAYDRLPPSVRQKLAVALDDYVANDVLLFLQAGRSIAGMLAMLDNNDKASHLSQVRRGVTPLVRDFNFVIQASPTSSGRTHTGHDAAPPAGAGSRGHIPLR